jgi:8-oxo-dGTP diphosphatase
MKPINELFGNKVRIRACGLCYNKDAILLIKHRLDDQILWAPPGGGVDFGESIKHTLVREFKEETSLDIEPGNFLFVNEFIEPPLHAVELFYQINSYSGKVAIGNDPEVEDGNIISELGFFNQSQIAQLPDSQLHRILKICNNPIDLLHIQGQLK